MKTRLSKKLIQRITNHAQGSLHRMNAGSADCYAFNLIGKGDWEGGWDWSQSLVDTDATHLLMLADNKIVTR